LEKSEKFLDIPKSNNLMKLIVDFGDHTRMIIAGIKQERENPGEIQVWAHGKNIYIKNKSTDNTIVYYYVCDILGQEIIRGKNKWKI